MTNQPRFAIRLAVSAGIAAALLSGCTAGDWREAAPPAAGVQAEASTIKVRNLVLVANELGEAVLFGAGVSPTADVLTSVTVSPIDNVGKASQARQTLTNISFAKNELTQTNVKITDRDLKPGLTASVTLRFDNAGETQRIVPILASTHPDFKEAYAKVSR